MSQQSISSSGLIFLFADHFAEPPKGMVKSTATDPRTGEKVAIRDLIVTAYVAAFAELAERGVLKLEPIEVRKALFMKDTAVAATLLTEPQGAELSLLEQRVVESVQSAKKPEQRRVRDVVGKSVGGSTNFPWRVALAIVREGALGSGLVTMTEAGEKGVKGLWKSLDPRAEPALQLSEQVGLLETQAVALKDRIAAFERQLGELAPRLRKEIADGLDACKTEDSGFVD